MEMTMILTATRYQLSFTLLRFISSTRKHVGITFCGTMNPAGLLFLSTQTLDLLHSNHAALQIRVSFNLSGKSG